MSKRALQRNNAGLTKAQKEEVAAAANRQPPAGITFIDERKLSESEIKKSLLILSRILSPDQRKVVKKALEDD